MAIFTLEQALKKTGTTPDKITSLSTPIGEETPTDGTKPFLQETAEKLATGEVNTVKALAERGKNLLTDINTEGAKDTSTGIDRVLGATAFASKKGIEAIAGGVGDIFSNMISPFISQDVKDKFAKGGKDIIEEFKTSWNTRPSEEVDPQGAKTYDVVHNLVNTLGEKAKDNPQVADILKTVAMDAFNISSLATGQSTQAPIKKAFTEATESLIEGVNATRNATGELVSNIGKTITPAIDTAKTAVGGVTDIARMTAEGASRIPSRIATNVAEQKAVRATIESLPSKVAKQAAQDGVDVADVKYLYDIPSTEKAPLKELYKAVKDFDSGVSKTDPIEVIGKPIIERIKTLESEAGKVGQKLSETAKTLGVVTSKELETPIFETLKKVRGLDGLKVKNGVLNFKDTVLTTAETASDRKAIQSIYSQAIKGGNGQAKHKLRQELFEILGGKKKSLTTLTDTQEKAYQAIRQGLSDVLDTKNSSYKALNTEYAKISEPLSDMRKYMKNVAGADEDILNMSAGLLARRLTSMAKSNPEIRNVLRKMDEVTKIKGGTTVSVENLQDFYNVLDKYYDIAGKTGFKEQVKTGIEGSKGIKDFISQSAGQIMSKTDAVKRKAIENTLDEVLK